MTKIIGGMATVPERWKHLPDIVEPLLPQFDELYIATHGNIEGGLDGALDHPRITQFIHTERRDDARKFYPLEMLEEPCYYFSLDDDLIYPPNYVEKMTSFIDKYDRQIIACVHGSFLTEVPIDSYYKDKKTIHFSQKLHQPLQVMFPGTGTAAFHTRRVTVNFGALGARNIADVCIGLWANGDSTPVLAAPRRRKWIRQHRDINALQESIWADRKDQDSKETDLINSFQERVGLEYPSLPPSEQSSPQADESAHSGDTPPDET